MFDIIAELSKLDLEVSPVLSPPNPGFANLLVGFRPGSFRHNVILAAPSIGLLGLGESSRFQSIHNIFLEVGRSFE